MKLTRERLDALYEIYNRPEFVTPDPLQCVVRYERVMDREVVGLLSAGLAYGRVASILLAIEKVLGLLGSHPSAFLAVHSDRDIKKMLAGFKYRWTSDEEVAGLLIGIKNLQAEQGSLEEWMVMGGDAEDPSLMASLGALTDALLSAAGQEKSSLLPKPQGNSACKRSMLFLRWMVRKDAVDPGGWDRLDPARLLIPLDTHMAGFAKRCRMTRRKSADRKMAEEITRSFAKRNPEDPVKYDFSITRLGIRAECSLDEFFK